jgi:hypothetical protein
MHSVCALEPSGKPASWITLWSKVMPEPLIQIRLLFLLLPMLESRTVVF